MNELLFPFAEYWWFYAGFGLLVLALLAVDLGVFHRPGQRLAEADLVQAGRRRRPYYYTGQYS